MQDNTPRLAMAVLVAGVVAISWSAIFVRWTEMPGVVSALYRVLIAAVVLWIALLMRGGRKLRVPVRLLPLAALTGIFFAGDLAFYNIAVLHTTAGGATFLTNNTPLIVGLLAWAMTRRLPSGRFWAALGVATLGAMLIVYVDRHRAGEWQHLRTASAADGLAFLASICFAFYLLSTERLRSSLDTATITALSTTVSTLTLLAVALGTHLSLVVPGWHALLAVVALGVVCQLGGYLCLTYALGHMPATISSIVLLGVAPLTALLAYWIFGEAMSRVQLLGGALILTAVWIITARPGVTSEPA
jgi:drug/metabolite transporter (DMT)-like permease